MLNDIKIATRLKILGAVIEALTLLLVVVPNKSGP